MAKAVLNSKFDVDWIIFLRAKKVEKLRNSSNKTNKYFIVNQDASKDRNHKTSKMKYRNWIPEPGTTISGFAASKKNNNNNNELRDLQLKSYKFLQEMMYVY